MHCAYIDVQQKCIGKIQALVTREKSRAKIMETSYGGRCLYRQKFVSFLLRQNLGVRLGLFARTKKI